MRFNKLRHMLWGVGLGCLLVGLGLVVGIIVSVQTLERSAHGAAAPMIVIVPSERGSPVAKQSTPAIVEGSVQNNGDKDGALRKKQGVVSQETERSPCQCPDIQAASSGVGEASRSEEPTPLSGEKSEEYWRSRANAARERLLLSYERCIAHASLPYKYVVRDSNVIELIDEAALAEAQASFRAARLSYEMLLQDARRAGAPAGWVRIDWSGYLPTQNPENAECGRVRPEGLSSL
jgi:hypothetical protein